MHAEGFLEHISQQLPTLSREHQAELARVIERLVATFEPEAIYLFGSQARGEATPDSDVDLLVIVEHSDLLPHQRDQAAYRAIGWHSFPLDVLVTTRSEFERRRAAVTSLAATVLREGRVLYAA
jgi:uncharacterized protein